MRYSVAAVAVAFAAFACTSALANTGTQIEVTGLHQGKMHIDREPDLAAHLTRTGVANVDPVVSQGQRDAPLGTFFLNSRQQTEKVAFNSRQKLDVCLSANAVSSQMPGDEQIKSVPLNVSWRNNSARLTPGHCVYFSASNVNLTPSTSLANSETLRGRVTTQG